VTYNPALDGLRAIAVLAVIAFHAKVPGLHGGFIGVDVFFVLSGYLITRLLSEEHRRVGRIDCVAFYARRLRRLSPTLFLMLGAYLLAAPLVWPQVPSTDHLRDAVLAAAYATDYPQALWHVPRYLVHTWSLSVEAHFYVLWPFAVLALLRLPLAARLKVIAGLYLIALTWRIYCCLVSGSFDLVYFSFDTRLGGLMLGSFIGLLPEQSLVASRRTLTQLGVISTIALGILLATAPWGLPIGLAIHVTVAHLAAAGLIMTVATHSDTPFYRVLSAWPMVVIGILSYGLYIWHYPISVALRESLPWYGTFALTLPLSLLGAVVSYVTVERGYRERRDGGTRRPAISFRSRDGIPGTLSELRKSAFEPIRLRFGGRLGRPWRG
jgi:peptidoglycan/LPS O-acetylase OafA/YrhL